MFLTVVQNPVCIAWTFLMDVEMTGRLFKMGDRQGKRARRSQSENDAPDRQGQGQQQQTSQSLSQQQQGGSGAPQMAWQPQAILQPKHKIFLSHSGAQKDFVAQLCVELEKRHRFPFFDKRPSSLPKGERFPELILKAAQQCQMAVVVVSDEYFKSKWPMIELHKFVQARLTSNTNLKILPLFYRLSVQEFGNEGRRDQWYKKWEDFAKADSRININEWKEALKALGSFNGIEYDQELGGVETYLKSILSNICTGVSADIKWDDSHVQGRSSLCEEIFGRIQQIQGSNNGKVCVIGFYGVGGIGKTTICNTLCNELDQEYEGKVSHIELGSQSLCELLKGVLESLTNTSRKLLQQLDEGKCKYILREGMCKQKTFLAIDNVWDQVKSIEEAKLFLQSHFHDESVVMVTSRSLKTLISLGINGAHCFEMPKLGHEDAKRLFLQHAAYGRQFPSHEDQQAIEDCVALCYFSTGDKRGGHYLPLALKALGVQLGYVGHDPSHWLKAWPKARDFNYFQEEDNPVFGILRSSFDRLPPNDRCLFIDVVMFAPVLENGEKQNLMLWLSLVHNQDVQEIESRLRGLAQRGLLEDVDMTSGTIRVHDVYREFAKLEAEGKLEAGANFEKRRWMWNEDTFPTELEMTPSHGCWQNLTRIGIRGKSCYIWESEESKEWWNVRSFQGIEWRNCSNVVVLKLKKLGKLRGDLNLMALKCLRSLELINIGPLETLDGLQDLKNLTYFRWIHYFTNTTNVRTRVGQLPSSLECLHLWAAVWLRWDLFARCTKLKVLMLNRCEADNLDFSACSSLEEIFLYGLRSLRSLSGLAATVVSWLGVQACDDLVEISELGQLVGLRELYLLRNPKVKKQLLDVQRLTRLQVLRVDMMEIEILGCLRRLRRLKYAGYECLVKLPNLSGFEQLQTVDLRCCYHLSSLDGVFEGDFPALRWLSLRECRSLSRLPDLSRLRNLEELDLLASSVVLGEQDICMLAALPMLHPVLVGGYPCSKDVRIDASRRKVLIRDLASRDHHFCPNEAWLSWTTWEERDLSVLPIKAIDFMKW